MKKRIDDILVEHNFFDNKSKAKANLIIGNVIVNNEKVFKPGTMFRDENLNIKLIKQNDSQFVSRAGMKLQKSIKKFSIDLNDKVCLDIGSSTGGFTQCCLENGAKKIFALDVGTNQLDYRLRTNAKIVSIEKTNFKYATRELFDEEIDFFCCDVSFISLKHILKPLENIVNQNVDGILLIKPQFEVEKGEVEKGRVNDIKLHKSAIIKVVNHCYEFNFNVKDLDFSPILGNKKKNIEYLIYIIKTNKIDIKKQINEIKIDNITKSAWEFFKENQYEEI